MTTLCPSCTSDKLKTFYTVKNVPVNSCLLFRNIEAAKNCPAGNIKLEYCRKCEFIFNSQFQPKLTEYKTGYESTQYFSKTFSREQDELANWLIDHFQLSGKSVVEIGCGNGEFLQRLTDLTSLNVLGFDPSHDPTRLPQGKSSTLRVIKDFYGVNYSHCQADLYLCLMTLEHIPEVSKFLQVLRHNISQGNDNACIFFQVPNAERILRDIAVEDIYYEHCSYFTTISLENLFKLNGFEVTASFTRYQGQYLCIEARLAKGKRLTPTISSDKQSQVENFQQGALEKKVYWQQKLGNFYDNHMKVAIWGGGSKAVAMLSGVFPKHCIDSVIDINPFKSDSFLPISALPVVAPKQLAKSNPDVVLIMNSIYTNEIASTLETLGVRASLLPLSN